MPMVTLLGGEPSRSGRARCILLHGFQDALRSRPPGADLLIGAQDFQGRVSEPVPDSDQPMFRGMITINVEVENFGQTHTAVFRLRGDTTRPDAPLRIFRIEHDGWSYP